jgi:hypothetical protein
MLSFNIIASFCSKRKNNYRRRYSFLIAKTDAGIYYVRKICSTEARIIIGLLIRGPLGFHNMR